MKGTVTRQGQGANGSTVHFRLENERQLNTLRYLHSNGQPSV
jgi:hypothetical protein